jgi:ribose-phosphate pyrophosphokinase
MKNNFFVFSGNGNKSLAQAIAKKIGFKKLHQVNLERFSSGEVWVNYDVETLRNKDVFIIQTTDSQGCQNVNESIMELLFMVDAARHAKAGRIIVVIPSFAYDRQDIKDKPHVPMSAGLIISLLETAGASHIMSAELHNQAITNANKKSCFDHLYLSQLLVPKFKKIKNLVVFSPDAGAAKMGRFYAGELGAGRAGADKIRSGHSMVGQSNIFGTVKNKNLLIIDDKVDTAGSLMTAIDGLKKLGALDIYGGFVHPVLSGKGVERIQNCEALKKVYFTNTINRFAKEKKPEKIKLVDTSKVFADTIYRFHKGLAISTRFKQNNI